MILTVTLNTAVDKLYRVEGYHPYEVMRVSEVNNTAGGKGLNVSRVAALLGEDVTAMGFVGGHNGALLESLITEPNIQKAFTRTGAETRCCINVWDEEKSQSTEFLEPGSPVTPEEVAAFRRDFAAQLPQADVVTISGSMPKGVPPNFYSELIELAHRENKPVLVDTSGPALQNAAGAKPAMIKPNTDEIGQIIPADMQNREKLVDAAQQLHRQGIQVVAVSLGEEGVLVACKEGVFKGIPPKIQALNTVGCGDSMLAGFAVARARGLAVQNAIRQAVAVSAANALTRQTGFFRKEDLESLLPLVTVSPL